MDPANEVWRVIPEFPQYECSSFGNLRNKDVPGHNLVLSQHANGYYMKQLNGKNLSVHRVVAQLFVPNPDGKDEVDHIDRVRSNNHFLNLRWTTRREQNENRKPAAKGKAYGMPIWQLDGATKQRLQYFDSQYAAAEWVIANNLCKADCRSKVVTIGIMMVCRGQRDSMYGCKWEFAEENVIENEIWKPCTIKGDGYEVSNQGRLRDRTQKVFKGTSEAEGHYLRFRDQYVHRLVAQAFLENPNNLPIVHHKNSNKQDNRLVNLMWVSASDNLKFSAMENKHRNKTIQCTDPVGNVATYFSVREVERQLGISQITVRKSIKTGNPVAGGSGKGYRFAEL